LPARGFTPIIAVPFEGELATRLRHAGVEVHVMELGVFRSRRELSTPVLLLRLLEIPVGAVRLARLVRRLNVAIVHSNTSVVLAGALGARMARRPHIWHVREIMTGRAWRILTALILRWSDRVICISRSVADSVVGGRSRTDRVRVVPDGVDLEQFTPSVPRRTGGSYRVGMVARVNGWKGHELFLRSARLVAAEVPAATFWLAGGYPPAYAALYRRLAALPAEFELDGRVTFLPHLQRDALRAFLASLDLLVVPSTAPEPGGLVALEAMALGIPVIATRQGGPLDLITDGVDGILVAAEAAELAHAVVTLLADELARDRLSRAARRRVEASYGLTAHLERLTALYREVLTRAG
jgi:glycosyltransferase involved in cell wall biosynthesis